MPMRPTETHLLRRVARVIARWGIVLGAVGLFFWTTGCMERMFYLPTAELTPVGDAPPRTDHVYFPSADGTMLSGWFIRAAHADMNADSDNAQTAATILHVHGNAGNVMHHTWFTEHLPPAGFNVFIFDFRGYGESEGTPRRRNDLIADTHAALDALLARDDVDAGRIGMYAQSLGAAIGVNVMADRSEIAAAVLESPFASWREMAASAVGGDPPHLIARMLAAVLIRDHSRPIDAIARIDRPILMIHGDADTIVPISHGRRLANAAPDVVEFHELPNGDHNTLRMSHTSVDGKMIEFFNHHLGQ
jgi:dipeptidyl aminopeptidase/acylaminoacyl peptidase